MDPPPKLSVIRHNNQAYTVHVYNINYYYIVTCIGLSVNHIVTSLYGIKEENIQIHKQIHLW